MRIDDTDLPMNGLVKQVMLVKRWSARQLADHLGITANTVWRYRAGTVIPSEAVAIHLAELAGLPVEQVLTKRAMMNTDIRTQVQNTKFAQQYRQLVQRHRQTNIPMAKVLTNGQVRYERVDKASA
jgi:transcriptional regulator with XRE-family HTH domain